MNQVITCNPNAYGTSGVPTLAPVPSGPPPNHRQLQIQQKPFLQEPNNNNISSVSSNLGHGHQWNSDGPIVDPSVNSAASSSTIVCNCASFLDPFPNQITWRSVSNLQHYCRVCNTQLNSCKQSRIHAEGKKHEKRLAYLKFCFENNAGPTNSIPSSPPANMGGVPTVAPPPAPPPVPPPVTQQLANQQMIDPAQVDHQSNHGAPPPAPPHDLTEVKSPTLIPASSVQAPPPISTAPPTLLSQMYPSYLHYTAPPAAFYFPAQSYHTTFPDFVALPTAPPPNTPLGMPMSIPLGPAGFFNGAPPTTAQTAVPPNQMQQQIQGQQADCRLTGLPKKANVSKGSGKKEKTLQHAPNKGTASSSGFGGSVTSSRTSNSSHVLTCDLCRLTFPSLSVLNNHVKGSRHMRKVKSQVAYKQMKAAGMSFKQECGEIQCEVCRVSVNSSHQLQAHLAGHKHKVRCYKRGLDPCATMITPTSTTPPSTAPSECSAPRSSVSSKYHQYTVATSNTVQMAPQVNCTKSLLGLPPKLPPKPALLGSSNNFKSGSSANKQMGLLGDYPATAAAVNALRGLLPLPLPKPSAPSLSINQMHKPVRSATISRENRDKTKTRKQPRKAKERRDSTTESDEATDATCVKKEPIHKAPEEAMVNPGSKDADLKNNNNKNNENDVDHESSESATPSSSSSCDKSSKGNDFSSDEAKESEGDSCDPIDKTNDQSNSLINYPANDDDTSGAASDSASPSPRIIQETKPVKHSCDICNITVNSATQLAQHMNSPKHHVKAAEGQQKSNQDVNNTTKKLKEIPMLNMFLKTLQPPPQYFPNQEKETECESSSNTEVER